MTLEDAIKPVHFDPEPIFVGPKPGWTGPVLAAKPTGNDAGVGRPDTASAYATDKPPLAEGGDPQSAPAALKGALRPVKLAPLAARPHKLAVAKPQPRQTLAAKAKKPTAAARLRPPLRSLGRSRQREKCLRFARLWSIRRRISRANSRRAAMVRFGAPLGVFCPPSPRAAIGP